MGIERTVDIYSTLIVVVYSSYRCGICCHILTKCSLFKTGTIKMAELFLTVYLVPLAPFSFYQLITKLHFILLSFQCLSKTFNLPLSPLFLFVAYPILTSLLPFLSSIIIQRWDHCANFSFLYVFPFLHVFSSSKT